MLLGVGPGQGSHPTEHHKAQRGRDGFSAGALSMTAPAPEGSDVLPALLPKCHHCAAGGQPQPSPLAGVLRGARGDGAILDGNEPQGGITE